MKKLFTFIAILLSITVYSQEIPVHKTEITIEPLLLSIITFNTSSVIPTDGLVAYYPFNGNANDESGHGNNGTVYGPALTTDRFNNPDKAYDFNGNNENRITLSPFIPPEITSISIWFNPINNGPGGNQNSVLFSNTQKFVNHDGMGMVMEAGVIFFGITNTAGVGVRINSNSPISLNQWHHVVCIIDSYKKLKMFLDNVEQSQTISWSGTYNGQNVTNIGNYVQDDDNFDGALDDVRIYDRALSASEIQALYNEGNPPIPVPISNWSLILGFILIVTATVWWTRKSTHI